MSTFDELHRVEERDRVDAICVIVLGVVPVEPPTPALSNVTTRRSEASASISAGSQLSRLPRKC